jgi:hypothetical protein
MNSWSLNLNMFSVNWNEMNSNMPPFGPRLRELAWPSGEFGWVGPCQRVWRGHRMVHACRVGRWRARRQRTSDRGGVQSMKWAPASCGQSTGQGGGGETHQGGEGELWGDVLTSERRCGGRRQRRWCPEARGVGVGWGGWGAVEMKKGSGCGRGSPWGAASGGFFMKSGDWTVAFDHRREHLVKGG